ncbi:hypothetical protein C8Q76DRAFT_796496 [Earliella scabrosa]|nr:hypothetical protein C8Q76DRAFT_796496 [Earliella scabrosa]
MSCATREASSKPTERQDAAVWATITIAFFSLARLGELIPNNKNQFDPKKNPTLRDLRADQHRDGQKVKVIHIPRTKVCADGEDVAVGRQEGAIDPWTALDIHLATNRLEIGSPLFGYRDPKGKIVSLTKRACMIRVREAATKAGKTIHLTGHSLRVGGTLEYLLRGVSFETVKAIGRWKSEAFALYLRRHAQILAPYLQAEQELHAAFTRLTLQIPPPR